MEPEATNSSPPPPPPRRRKKGELDKIVAVNYTNILSPTAFGGISVQQKYYGRLIDRESLRKGLSRAKGYTLKKPWEGRKIFNPTFVYKKRELFQVDLLTVSQYARSNGGVNYLLTGIDCFTRFGFALPLKSKRGEEVAAVFDSFLQQLEEKPKRLVSDRGVEFESRNFQAVLAKYNIRHSVPKTSKHAAFVERYNRSLSELLSAYLAGKKKKRFIDDLPRLLHIYNGRRHRMIRLSPYEAEKRENYHHVLSATLNNYATRVYKAKKAQQKRWQRGERAIRKGDTVRVVTDQEAVFRKGYRGRFENELFLIEEIDTSLIVPLYVVKRKEGAAAGERLFFKFYRHELQLVSPDIDEHNFPAHELLGVEADRVKIKWTALPEEKFHVWMPRTQYEELSGKSVAENLSQ